MKVKVQPKRQPLRSHFISALKTTLLGVLLLVLGGAVFALALSVAGRYRSPEDALIKYQNPPTPEPRWHDTKVEPSNIEDLKVTQRHVLENWNAVQLIFTWRQNESWDCAGSLLVREIQDLFGGWEEMHYSGGGCSSGSGGGGSASYDFWESPAWEFPRYYYFAYIGTAPDDGAIEFVLSDSTRASASPVEDSVGLVVRRSAPFYIEEVNYLDDSGDVLYSHAGH